MKIKTDNNETRINLAVLLLFPWLTAIPKINLNLQGHCLSKIAKSISTTSLFDISDIRISRISTLLNHPSTFRQCYPSLKNLDDLGTLKRHAPSSLTS